MRILFLILSLGLLASCTVTVNTCEYFQTQSTNVKSVDGKYRYEDSLVIIDYNLWSSGGELLFKIYNKSDVPLYVNWENCNFIYNAYNNQYYTAQTVATRNTNTFGFSTQSLQGHSNTTVSNDIYNTSNSAIISTDSKYKTISNFSALTNEVTTVSKEMPSIQIPPRSYNIIYKFNLNVPLYIKHDSSFNISYTKLTTPLLFRNYLAISKDRDFKTQIFIDNEFWISAINTIVEANKDNIPCFDNTQKQPQNFYLYNKKEYQESDYEISHNTEGFDSYGKPKPEKK